MLVSSFRKYNFAVKVLVISGIMRATSSSSSPVLSANCDILSDISSIGPFSSSSRDKILGSGVSCYHAHMDPLVPILTFFFTLKARHIHKSVWLYEKTNYFVRLDGSEGVAPPKNQVRKFLLFFRFPGKSTSEKTIPPKKLVSDAAWVS